MAKSQRFVRGLCRVTRKRKFSNQADAFDVAQRQLRGGNLVKLSAYKCPHCGYWHLTRQSQ